MCGCARALDWQSNIASRRCQRGVQHLSSRRCKRGVQHLSSSYLGPHRMVTTAGMVAAWYLSIAVIPKRDKETKRLMASSWVLASRAMPQVGQARHQTPNVCRKEGGIQTVHNTCTGPSQQQSRLQGSPCRSSYCTSINATTRPGFTQVSYHLLQVVRRTPCSQRESHQWPR